MTSWEYIREVKQRVDRKNTALEYNDMMVLASVNYGRQNVFQYTYPIMPERYGRIIHGEIQSDEPKAKYRYNRNITGTDQVCNMYRVEFGVAPDILYLHDMIELYTVIVTWQEDGVTFEKEAREVDLRESYNVGAFSWNTPITISPSYIMERVGNNTFLYIGGLEYGSGTLFDIVDNNTINVRVEYVGMLPPLAFIDTDTSIGEDHTELVILEAMSKLLLESNMEVQARQVMVEIQGLLGMISSNYDRMIITRDIELPSKEV